MRILIHGAGALGSFVGGLLSTKYDVTFVGRAQHLSTIDKYGLRIEGKTSIVVHPKVAYTTSSLGVYDLIILTVKSYDTENAIHDIKHLINENTLILSLQNGLHNIEKISNVVGASKVIGGVTSHGITFVKNGLIYHAGVGDTVIGELSNEKTDRIQTISKLFNSVKLRTGISDNIMRDIWGKVIVNAGINPLTAITRLENGYLLRIPELERILEISCREGVEVANKAGIFFIEDIVKKAKDIARFTAENKSSMLQDVERKKRTEIDAINGAIVIEGKKYGVPTPVNSILLCLVKSIEKSYCKNNL